MANSLGQVVILIINSLGGLFLLALMLRFLLQASRADFYNPVSQSLVKLTSPLLNPLRKIIPSYRGFDFATLVLALVFNTLATALMIFSAGFVLPDIGTLISWSFLGILDFILDIYFYGLLISVISSWIAPYSGNPVLLLIHQLLEPVQSIFRRIIPPMGGLDFSPIFIFLAIQIIKIMVVGTLANGLHLGSQAARYVIGI